MVSSLRADYYIMRKNSRYTRRVTTVFIPHARQDQAFARELAEFLEFGCDLTGCVDDGLGGEGQDLISKAEDGLSADVLLLLLLTRASSLSRWVREPPGIGAAGLEHAGAVGQRRVEIPEIT